MAIAALRFNNPGNVSLPIQGWSGGGSIVGISGQPSYAAFPDMQTGLAAFKQRLTNYIDVKGYNTISSLNSVYAQDQNWQNGVSANSGIGLNTPLNTGDAGQMAALQGGIIKQETGMNPATFGLGGPTLDYVNAAGADQTPFSSQLPSSAIDPYSAGDAVGSDGQSLSVVNPPLGFGDQTPASLLPDSASVAPGTQAGTDGINAQAWTDPAPTGSDASAPTFDYTATAQDIPNAINQQSKEQAGSATAIAKATAAAGQAQAKATLEAAGSQNKVAASDTAAALQTGSSWIANIENWGSGLFARFGFVILGSILLIFGLIMISGKGPEVVSLAKKAAIA